MNSSFNERNLFNLIESFLSEEDMTSQELNAQNNLEGEIDDQRLNTRKKSKRKKENPKREERRIKQEEDEEPADPRKIKKKEDDTMLDNLEKLSDDASNLSGPGEDKERKVPGEDEERNHENDAVNFESFVREVNNLRAGRSLTSSEFKSEVRKYYDSLPDSVKTAVYAVIHGFWQVLSGEQSEDALRPRSLGSSCEKSDTEDIKKVVTDDGDTGQEVQPKMKKVVKKKVPKPTSTPIVVGSPIKAESFQDKREILKVLRKNNVI